MRIACVEVGRWVPVVVGVIFLAGCGGDRTHESRQNMHQLQKAMLAYAEKHKDEWPERLDQIKDEVGGASVFAKLMKNPLTGDDPGYEYVRPKGRHSDPGFHASQQVILYQLRGGNRDTSLKVGYADGSVRALGSK